MEIIINKWTLKQAHEYLEITNSATRQELRELYKCFYQLWSSGLPLSKKQEDFCVQMVALHNGLKGA